MKQEEEAQVDARNTLCPVPIIKLSTLAKTVEPGTRIRILATDPGFIPDIKAWCKGTRNELLQLDQDGSVITAVIRKAR